MLCTFQNMQHYTFCLSGKFFASVGRIRPEICHVIVNAQVNAHWKSKFMTICELLFLLCSDKSPAWLCVAGNSAGPAFITDFMSGGLFMGGIPSDTDLLAGVISYSNCSLLGNSGLACVLTCNDHEWILSSISPEVWVITTNTGMWCQYNALIRLTLTTIFSRKGPQWTKAVTNGINNGLEFVSSFWKYMILSFVAFYMQLSYESEPFVQVRLEKTRFNADIF